LRGQTPARGGVLAYMMRGRGVFFSRAFSKFLVGVRRAFLKEYLMLFWVYLELFLVYLGLFQVHVGLSWVCLGLFWAAWLLHEQGHSEDDVCGGGRERKKWTKGEEGHDEARTHTYTHAHTHTHIYTHTNGVAQYTYVGMRRTRGRATRECFFPMVWSRVL